MLWAEINRGGFGEDRERAAATYETYRAVQKAQKLTAEVLSQPSLPLSM